MMKKQLIAILASLLLITGFAGTASARDMTGTFGLGTDSSLLSTNVGPATRGISLNYYLHKLVGLQVLFGMDYGADSGDNDTKNSAMNWFVGLKGMIPFALSEQVNLSGIIGLNVGGQSNTMSQSSNSISSSYTSFWLDLGLRPEWFISEHLSVHTQVGISLFFASKDFISYTAGSNPGNSSGIRMSMFSGAQLVGQAGVTFWF